MLMIMKFYKNAIFWCLSYSYYFDTKLLYENLH